MDNFRIPLLLFASSWLWWCYTDHIIFIFNKFKKRYISPPFLFYKFFNCSMNYIVACFRRECDVIPQDVFNFLCRGKWFIGHSFCIAVLMDFLFFLLCRISVVMAFDCLNY